MQQNVGDTDRLVRILVGALLGALSLAILGNAVDLPTILSPVLGALAVIMLLTGATNTCPIYAALGMNTRQAR